MSRRAPKRHGRPRFKVGRDPAFLIWLGRQRCVIEGCRRRGEPAHVVSRGAGGCDCGNAIPLCRTHHREQHRIGILSFQATHAIDMAALGIRYGATYLQETLAA